LCALFEPLRSESAKYSMKSNNMLPNHRPALDCSMTRRLHVGRFQLAASEADRYAAA
jgi:hypothetical protein